MGTRSTYRIREVQKLEDGKKKTNNLVLIYVQFDGYPEGHPAETAEWLASGEVVNGLSMNDKKLKFNGAGCLAAQMVARMKDGPGGVYIFPVSNRGTSWEDYLYDIVIEDMKINFIAYENYGKRPKKIFEGHPSEFPKFLEKLKSKEE